MDSRVSTLIHTLKSEGLSSEDREAAHHFPSAAAAGNYADLLRGKLAETGGLLGGCSFHVTRGLSAGRVLLAGLLDDYGQCQNRPEATMTEREVAAFTRRLHEPSLSCANLLNLIYRVKKENRLRQTAAALKAHLNR